MYLSARKYINKIDWNKVDHNSDNAYNEATIPQWNDVINAAEMNNVAETNDIYGVQVQVNCAYWRKVNAVHKIGRAHV